MFIKGRRWRIILVTGAIILMFGGILLRLYGIQVSSVHSFSREEANLIARAQEQQNREFVVDSGRGSILDRRGRPFTYQKEWRLISFPMSRGQLEANQKKLERLASILDMPYGDLASRLAKLQGPMALAEGRIDKVLSEGQSKAIRSLAIPGIYALKSDNRSGTPFARPLIGRLERNPFLIREKYPEEWKNGVYHSQSRIGVTGLEASFEPFLRGGSGELLVYGADGRGRPLNGTSITKGSGEKTVFPYQLVTTLDKDIQRTVEEVLAENGVQEGAVVVQDIASGDILGMASRPDGSTAKKDQNPWDNRALMEATPGSIFKTVVAVAALDTGKVKPSDTFECSGKLGRYGLTDTGSKGHGEQTFAEAYANSCNITFAQVAEKLGGKTIESYARRMGLGQAMIWKGELFKEKDFHQLKGEEKGLIFAEGTSRKDRGVLAQTGIGQRDVRMTPLQAANMVTTLFHGGKTINPRVVNEIRRYDGTLFFRFPSHALKMDKTIGVRSLKEVRQMMRGVVTQGTARSMKGASIPLSGKTGTAQIGSKGDRYNKWMVGYAPYDRPRWSVSVVVRSVDDPKEMRAQTIFRQVLERIHRLPLAKKKTLPVK
ncbi:peptidoglycan D,D-transpeptidase FtsI family protein [Salinithrix halophila]|uniref:Peptidoglycan D,D-transpeptidase FtsI family protein n=1 Tax=Salinithrix halophila TaxID=1485204 RepID=A0ABV8JG53_9BACL